MWKSKDCKGNWPLIEAAGQMLGGVKSIQRAILSRTHQYRMHMKDPQMGGAFPCSIQSPIWSLGQHVWVNTYIYQGQFWKDICLTFEYETKSVALPLVRGQVTWKWHLVPNVSQTLPTQTFHQQPSANTSHLPCFHLRILSALLFLALKNSSQADVLTWPQ